MNVNELTVVLFRGGQDVGLVAGNVEVLDDSDTQMVLTATFDTSDDEVAGVLAEANEDETIDTPARGIGHAEGEVVGHSGRASELQSD